MRNKRDKSKDPSLHSIDTAGQPTGCSVDQVSLTCSGEVTLIQGRQEELTIETDDNVHHGNPTMDSQPRDGVGSRAWTEGEPPTGWATNSFCVQIDRPEIRAIMAL